MDKRKLGQVFCLSAVMGAGLGGCRGVFAPASNPNEHRLDIRVPSMQPNQNTVSPEDERQKQVPESEQKQKPRYKIIKPTQGRWLLKRYIA